MPTVAGQRYSNGGAVLDIDGDGEEEVIVGRGTTPRPNGEGGWRDSKLYWFDPIPGREFWDEHYIADSAPGNEGPHDIQPYGYRIENGEEVRGIVFDISRRELYFMEIPEDPRQPWIRHEIGTFPIPVQSGMVIVDVNGDGRNDIVSGMFWVEAPRDPRRGGWTFHRFGTWHDDKGQWGGMIKHAVADFDGDGQVEIVAAEAEIPGARLALFDRRQSDGAGLWGEMLLDGGLYAPHSVVVGDLDHDGSPDFLVGEMSAGGWDYPLNPSPKIYGYINRGGHFERYLVDEGWGVHEMRVMPERVNGDLVVYAAEEIQPQKFEGMTTYLNYWIIGPREGAGRAVPNSSQ